MARRNEHSLDEIKEMVLDAAETIIIHEGYSALTVRKIAKEIGYTVASIYMVFANMAELTLYIKFNTIDDLNRELQQVSNCAPEQYITELTRSYLHFAVKNFNRWSMIFVQDDNNPEVYQEKINLIFSPLEAQFALLAPYSPEQHSKQAARTLWSGVHGICVLSLTGRLDAVAINDVENAIVLLVESFIGGWIKTLADS